MTIILDFDFYNVLVHTAKIHHQNTHDICGILILITVEESRKGVFMAHLTHLRFRPRGFIDFHSSKFSMLHR